VKVLFDYFILFGIEEHVIYAFYAVLIAIAVFNLKTTQFISWKL